MEFYKQILQQLGGNRFIAMTGTKNFVYDLKELSLSMKLSRNKANATHLKIQVNSLDLYDLTFYKCTEQIEVVKQVNNIYDDMLQPIFTEVTGLYTKF